jgi:energy-coupling factor transporter ATP-binding protein EcfA2
MGRYIGEIKIKDNNNSYFVNFFPAYEITGGKLEYLNTERLRRLLPESQFQNINLGSSSASFRLDEHFADGDDIVIEFDQNDLLENRRSDGMRYQTAWKLDMARDIHYERMEEAGYYYVLDPSMLEGSYRSDAMVSIVSYDVNEGMKVLIPDENSPELLTGPFEVKYSEENDSLYILPNAAGRKYIFTGFSYPGGWKHYVQRLEMEDVTRSYIRIDIPGVKKAYVDVITEQALLEQFKEMMQRKSYQVNRIDLSRVENLLDTYERSLLTGVNLTPQIAQSRMAKLRDLFNAEINYSRAFQSLSSVFSSTLSRFKNEPEYEQMLSGLANDPAFTRNLSSFDAFNKKEKEMHIQIHALEQKRDSLQALIEKLEKSKPQEQIERMEKELSDLQSAIASAQKVLDEKNRTAYIHQTLAELEAREEWLQKQIESKERKSEQLDTQIETLESRVDEILRESTSKAMEISLDNLLSNRMLVQAAKLEHEQETERYVSAARALKGLEHSYLHNEDLIAYLVRSVQKLRPNYSRNMIINIMICLSSSFLTIFSGEPGSGKSSICKICAGVLGLNEPGEILQNDKSIAGAKRFVHVAVERGWTSRRDFIGYYNSLTRTFDKSNKDVFDLLAELDQESRQLSLQSDLPALILLDDANLSSMEYYWADFMTMTEPGSVRGNISLGDEYSFQIPKNLRFAATINTDHTTEPLSQRLLDRAMVISLPDLRISFDTPLSLRDISSQLITETQLAEVFTDKLSEPDPKTAELLENILARMKKDGIKVSTRSEIAINSYLCSALPWFEEDIDTGASGAQQALDYAIAQKVLPQISGSGEPYRNALEDLADFFEQNKLYACEKTLRGIIASGDENMQYYQYFH